MEPGLGAVIFLTFMMAVVFGTGAYLVYRVMNRPGSHIGSRLPKDDRPASSDDSPAEADPPERTDPESGS